CEVKQSDSLSNARANALEFLTKYAGKATPPPPAPMPKPVQGGLWNTFIPVPGGQIHACMNDDVPTMPILVQHDAASSIGNIEPIARSLVGRRTVLAFDMPGLGDSDNIVGNNGAEVGNYSDVLAAVLDTFGLDRIDYYGMRGGALVG